MIILDKCNGSYNAIDDLFTKICVPSKTKDLNIKILDMITRICKSKTLIKHISCDCTCKFSSIKCSSNLKWNYEKCQDECKKYCMCKKNYS